MPLFKGKKIYSKIVLNEKRRWKKRFRAFFTKQNCNEIEHGIIENHKISLRTWKKALNQFKGKQVFLKSRGLKINLFSKINKNFIKAYLFGGGIKGLCQKKGIKTVTNSIIDSIICPNCLKENKEIKLEKQETHIICNNCKSKFPIINNILLLFSSNKLKELYPEYS